MGRCPGVQPHLQLLHERALRGGARRHELGVQRLSHDADLTAHLQGVASSRGWPLCCAPAPAPRAALSWHASASRWQFSAVRAGAHARRRTQPPACCLLQGGGLAHGHEARQYVRTDEAAEVPPARASGQVIGRQAGVEIKAPHARGVALSLQYVGNQPVACVAGTRHARALAAGVSAARVCRAVNEPPQHGLLSWVDPRCAARPTSSSSARGVRPSAAASQRRTTTARGARSRNVLTAGVTRPSRGGGWYDTKCTPGGTIFSPWNLGPTTNTWQGGRRGDGQDGVGWGVA